MMEVMQKIEPLKKNTQDYPFPVRATHLTLWVGISAIVYVRRKPTAPDLSEANSPPQAQNHPQNHRAPQLSFCRRRTGGITAFGIASDLGGE